MAHNKLAMPRLVVKLKEEKLFEEGNPNHKFITRNINTCLI